MTRPPTPRGARIFVVVLGFLFLVAVGSGNPAGVSAAGTVTPAAGAMTVYAVTNPNSTSLNVQHVFSNSAGFNYSFWSQIPANSTATYHVSTISQIPSPFQGTVTLYADAPFTAQITGYDYPPPAGTFQNKVYLPFARR